MDCFGHFWDQFNIRTQRLGFLFELGILILNVRAFGLVLVSVFSSGHALPLNRHIWAVMFLSFHVWGGGLESWVIGIVFEPGAVMMVWITNSILGDCALVGGLPTYFGFYLSFSLHSRCNPSLEAACHCTVSVPFHLNALNSPAGSVSSNFPPLAEHRLCPSR